MIIDSSNLQLSGLHTLVEQQSKEESHREWVGLQRPDFERQSPSDTAGPGTAAFVVDLSPAALESLSGHPQKDGSPEKANPGAETDVEQDPKLRLTRLLIEKMIGHKIRVLSLKEVQPDAGPTVSTDPQAAAQSAPERAGWGLEYDSHEVSYEKEVTGFQAQGVVRTGDGREIKLDISLEMSRQFTTEETVSVRAGDGVKKDPLVINLNGQAAQLTDSRFEFDLEADGRNEQIAFVKPGSGFLALDRNADGKVTSGKELFGPSTGDGFAELATLDGDQNNWIDERDPAFSKLLVWTKDAQGNNQLSTLRQNGIGAVYLGKTATPFDIRSIDNQALGQVKSTGVYVQENGQAGTVQQVDLNT